MNNEDGQGSNPETPKYSWVLWIPIIGMFFVDYPCHNIGLDIWHSSWCICIMLIFVSC